MKTELNVRRQLTNNIEGAKKTKCNGNDRMCEQKKTNTKIESENRAHQHTHTHTHARKAYDRIFGEKLKSMNDASQAIGQKK